MMNGDQPKMDALTPVIGQALNVRDQLRVEMGNQMGLGSDGSASQGKSYTGSYETQLNNKDEITEFVKKVKEAEANIPDDQGMYGLNKGSAPEYENIIPVTEIPKGQFPFNDAPPIWEPYIIDPNKKREDIKEFLLSDVGDQSKPRGGGGFNNPLGMNGYGNNRVQLAANDSVPMMGLNDQEQEYIDSMSQTYGGMSEGLEDTQANTRESILNSLSPELRSKADVYVGMGDTKPKVEDEMSESQSKGNRIAELESNINGYYMDKAYMELEDFDKKYMGGSIYSPQLLDSWKNELADLRGEGYANDYVDGEYWRYKNNRLMFEEACNNVTGIYEYDHETHTLEYHDLFESTDDGVDNRDTGSNTEVELYSTGKTKSALINNITNYWWVKACIIDDNEFDKLFPPGLYEQWTTDLAGLVDNEKELEDFVNQAKSEYDINRLKFEDMIKDGRNNGIFEFNLETLTLEFKPDPLKSIDTEKLGFADPNYDNCYIYQDENGIYHFGASSKPNNVYMNLGAFVPFATPIAKSFNEIVSDIDYINGDEASVAMDAVGLLDEVKNSPVVRIAGKGAVWLSRAINLYNFTDSIISNEAEIIQITECLFGPKIKSSTREGCMNKFLVYFNITKKAVDEGVITYKPWCGIMFRSDIKYDFYEFKDLIDSTGIDFGDLQEYYK